MMRLGSWLKVGGWGALLLAAAIAIYPEAQNRLATRRARACLAEATAPRGPTLRDCASLVRDFDAPSNVGYTRHEATYRAEELYARVQVARYVDAAVGNPDPDGRTAAVPMVARAEDLLVRGSRRISLEELGPAMGAPNVGKLAVAMGDRRTLLDHADRFGLWSVRKQVLEAALLEGNLDQLADIAAQYSEWDPRDADLRSELGAALCLSDPKAGSALLSRMPSDRADKRYANIQRNYGELFALLTACNHKAGLPAPPAPTTHDAGVLDEPMLRLLTELRLGAAGPARERLLSRAEELLDQAPPLTGDPEWSRQRAMLLAALIHLGPTVDPHRLAHLLSGPSKAPPLAPSTLTARGILRGPPGIVASLPPAWLASAATRVRDAASATKEQELSRALLRGAAGLTQWEAVILAENGDAESASSAAQQAGAVLSEDPRGPALSAASAAYVAGDSERARSLLEASEAVSGEDGAITAELATLRVLVHASLGDLESAQRETKRLARVGQDALGLEPETRLEAQLVALAFGELPPPPPKAESALPWLLAADKSARFHSESPLAAHRWLETMTLALALPSNEQRAFRYQLLTTRGDAPLFALAPLVLWGRLLGDEVDGAGVEVWQDAMLALDQPRLRLRSLAFFRAEAARVRGDSDHAAIWSERLRLLRTLASDEENLEIASYLRL